MKKSNAALRVLLITILIAASSLAAFAQGSRRVRGYTRKNGTHVQPYRRTAPNRTERDNYSTKGNTNPYTGKRGTKTPRR